MRKIVALLIVALVLLVGIELRASKFSDIVAQHLQSEFTAQATPARNVWGWIEYVREAWIYEPDRPGELCQQPWVSDKRLQGDCDDFAVMIAYYVQEYWKHDTYIIQVYNRDKEEYHATAFFWVTEAVLDSESDRCGGGYRYQTWKGRIYIPIDWEACPDWTLYAPFGSKMYEWDDVVGTPR